MRWTQFLVEETVTDHQAKLYGLYLVALELVNSKASSLTSTMETIQNMENHIEYLREMLSKLSHQHGVAVHRFQNINAACDRFKVERRLTLAQSR